MAGFEKKTVLITGSTGLIGYNLAKRLTEEEGCRLILTGRSMAKLEKTFAPSVSALGDRVVLRELSIGTGRSLECDERVDYIFHAAGSAEREVIMKRPVDVLSPNVTGTRECLEFLKRQKERGHSGRLVVFSSVTVYGAAQGDEMTVREGDLGGGVSLENPYATYAESKRMSEVIARAYYRHHGVDSVIARLSTVYGYCPNVPDSAFYEFVKRSLSGEDIELKGAGMPRRDNIYVEDAVEGLLSIATKGEVSLSYNVSSNGEGDNYAGVDEIASRVARVTAKVTGKEKVNVKVPSFERRAPGVLLDNERLKGLGWRLRYGMEEALTRTIRRFVEK